MWEEVVVRFRPSPHRPSILSIPTNKPFSFVIDNQCPPSLPCLLFLSFPIPTK
jgi:hypothetical protein